MKRGIVILIIVVWILAVVFVAAAIVLVSNSASSLIKEETLSIQNIDTIILHNDRKSVEIVATETAQAKILQYGRPGTATEDMFSIDISDVRATINNKSRFEIFNLWTFCEKLILEIPASWIGNIELNSTSGGISIEDSFAWKDVRLSCTSGGIDINQTLTADNIEIYVTSGAIRVYGELKSSGAIKAESISGGIRFNMPIKAREVCLKATSGSITLDKTDASNLEISNSSGRIKIGETKTNNFELENSSGGINVTEITGSGSMKATSGNIKVRLNDPTGKVNLEAKSGSIRISVDASLAFSFSGKCTSGLVRANFPLDGSENNASAIIGNNSTAIITATTTSGGININQE